MRMTSPTELIDTPSLDAAWTESLLLPAQHVDHAVLDIDESWIAADEVEDDADDDDDDDEDDDFDDDEESEEDEDEDEDDNETVVGG